MCKKGLFVFQRHFTSFILTVKAKIVSESLVFLDHSTPCYNPDDSISHCHSHGRLLVDTVTLSCRSRNCV